MNETSFVWFTDEDVAIVGNDICSKCLLQIDEDEVPLMLFREHVDCERAGRVDIARFHSDCADKLILAGVIRLVP